jgi:hypothetical protein
MQRLAISSVLLVVTCGCLRAEDCSKKFTIGEFGIPQADAAVVSGKLFPQGFVPVYMKKQKVEETPEVCRYVYAFDVFQLTPDKEADVLYAGCYGDFNADGARDYVLLLASAADRKKTELVAFVHTRDGYRAMPLGQGVIDDGYIPRCIRRPQDGVFHALEAQEFHVVGDVITYGWYSYLWEKDGFREILTSD